jgi:hypothetical protein
MKSSFCPSNVDAVGLDRQHRLVKEQIDAAGERCDQHHEPDG